MGKSRVNAARSRIAANVTDAAPIFAALGDVTRLTLIKRLCDQGPLPIAKLASGTLVSRQAVTKHLHALESVGLARCNGAGRGSIWEMQTRRLAEVCGYLDQISDHWDQALSRLRTVVES
ncbi:MAG: ArsR family transcriptional regulator [Acidobacteriota bacterium]|nr:ArsR family transcriptional regulator [Acidobacteriota bacterium]